MRLIINGEAFTSFTEFEVSIKYAAIASSFSFSGERLVLPKKSTYPKVVIYDDDNNKLITGTVVNTDDKSSAKPHLVNLSGYSLAGVLEDSDFYDWPLQFDNLNLKEIVEKVFQPFNVPYVIDSSAVVDMQKKYKKTTVDIGQKVKSYINELAAQRGIVLTHNADGAVIFQKKEVKVDKAKYNFSETGYISMSLSINGQQMHSHIKVVRQASADNPDAGEAEIQNPYVPVYRPKVKVLNSGDIFDVEKAARMELGNELRAITLSIQVLFYIPVGEIIEVKNPEIGINRTTEFFVEQVSIKGGVSADTYTLSCVLKDVYSLGEVKNTFQ